MIDAAGVVAAAPTQVIPNFGGSNCPAGATFCWSWVVANWGDNLAPRLVEHIYITAIAVGIGLVISVGAALIAYSQRWFEKGFIAFSTLLYSIPSLVLFLAFIPVTGLTVTTIEIGLVGYTFLLLFRNTLTGLRSVSPDVTAAAVGMGLTRRQVLFRINIPLALPSIMAGVRIATVTAISLATIAANATPYGLGQPIFFAIHTLFSTELIAAGLLAILLALVADTLIVGLQRLITPWVRAGRRA